MKAKSSMTWATMFLMILAVALVPVMFPTQGLAAEREEGRVDSILYSASKASVIGLVAVANPGLEKTVTYQFPFPPSTSFTTPFFTDLEVEEESMGGGSGRRVLARNFDTTMVMTNIDSDTAGVDVKLTFFDQAGMPINGTDVTPIMVHIDPKGTQVRLVSALLNP